MRVRVTKRYRKRIRGIKRVRKIRNLQQSADHLLDLRLFGSAISGDCDLDLRRGVLVDGKIRFSGGVDANAPRMSELESALHIRGMENAFKHGLIRFQLPDNAGDPAVDGLQP